MLTKVIAVVSIATVFISGCMVDSMSNIPIIAMLCGIALLGVTVMIDRETFR